MKGKKSLRVSVKDVAVAAGVSRAAASLALLNRPGVSKATRERILRIAKNLGYAPDARIASWMAGVRDAKSKDLLPIAWLNTCDEKDAWHEYKFYSPYLEGARERALQFGYRLEELWLHQPLTTMAHIDRILYKRGIEGVIVTPPARHVRLNWDRLAGISIGGGDLLAPRLHRVMADGFNNLLLALKMVNRHGYQRIGICLQEYIPGKVDAWHAVAHLFDSRTPKLRKVPPLFYTEKHGDDSMVKRQIAAWVSQRRPDVIICHNNQILAWVQEAGYRVPEEIGVVHLATDDDVSDWAGVTSKRREIGAMAVDLVVSLVNSRQFGTPGVACDTLIRGSWHPGRTLLIPKPK